MNEKEIKELLKKGNLKNNVAGILFPAMKKREIITLERAACFLATLAVESRNFYFLVENLNYSAEGLAAVWPKRFKDKNGEPTKLAKKISRKPELIANIVYANRMGNGAPESGDGWRYRGRGYIQLTGKDNYKKYGEYLGINLLENPELAEKEDIAAEIAAEFWYRSDLNEAADVLDLVTIRKRINGGLIGFNEFKGLVFKMLT